MEKVLNQEEIDAMFRAARGARSREHLALNVKPCNFVQAGQIKKEQVRAISVLHEGFARNLTNSLGAYLRVIFDTNLVSVEQLSYREFLSRIPDVAYCASFQVQPMNATAVLEMDLSLALPIIDLLLGGDGLAETTIRDVTHIEEQILEGVVKILCRELEAAWQPLGQTFSFEKRQEPAQMHHLLPLNEKTLSLSFEIRMANSQGMLNLAFPAVVSNALLRKLSLDWGHQKRRGSEESNQLVRERVRQCSFNMELALPARMIPVRALSSLKPGDTLTLLDTRQIPAILRIGGRNLFHAMPVRAEDRVAAEIVECLAIPPEEMRDLN